MAWIERSGDRKAQGENGNEGGQVKEGNEGQEGDKKEGHVEGNMEIDNPTIVWPCDAGASWDTGGDGGGGGDC